MTKVDAVIFDLDGTLLNTFEHIVQAFEVVLPAHNVAADRKAIRAVIGKTLIDCYQTLAPEGDYAAMARLHHETQQTPQMYALIMAYEGLHAMVDGLHADGKKAAVLTNRSRRSVDLIFEYVGITNMFDLVVTYDDIAAKKPDPTGVAHICHELGVAAERTVVVGDTPIDIETARNAHARASVVLTHGFGTLEELQGAKPDFIIDSLSELAPTLAIIEKS